MDGLSSHDDHDGGANELDASKVLQVPGGVLQTVGGHIIQVGGVGSDGDAGSVLSAAAQEDEESRKRRELLARRPSYRKIFNELSDNGIGHTVPKVEENDDSNDSMNSDDLQNNSAFSSQGGGLQTLTMTNAATTAAQVASNSGATIVQYAQGPDGQFFIPVSTISAGNISYQITPANAVAQGVVMASGAGSGEEASRKRELRLLKNRYDDTDPTNPAAAWMGGALDGNALIGGALDAGSSPSALIGGGVMGGRRGAGSEEATRKLELRLLKNREAARECRRKKKEYIKCLENRVALLENQNKTLIEELKSLKELYCQKETQS